MATAKPFPCVMVRRADDVVSCAVEQITLDALPADDVVIEVVCSSLNYKDALACQAHPGVVRNLPHVPGIDVAGHVASSDSPDYSPGDAVLVTGYDLGAAAWGGYAAYVRVPADWVVPLPEGLTIDQAMTYGTAGFTAAQCVAAIRHHRIKPDAGEVVVTGASGGVGSVSIAILAKLGYEVAAVTGKRERADSLLQLGAARVLPRETASDDSDRPLLAARWSAGVDTVGGRALATILRSTTHRACIAACGLASSPNLPTTVYPFILRGVTLAGIDSAKCPRATRLEMWRHLANDWNVADRLQPLVREITLTDVPREAAAMLAGKTYGRILVRPIA